jgi:ABC-type multidrug transport system fused ATPase/permease subunit
LGKQSRGKRGPVDAKVRYGHDLVAFLIRYFPSFMGSIFMCMFSIALATVQVFQAHLDHDPQRASYMVIFLLGASTVLTLSGFMLSRGRLWATWILVAILVTCLLTVLFYVPVRTQAFYLVTYTLSLICPLLGLLSLNSKRNRELRTQLAYNRSIRASLREDIRQRNALERHRENLRKNKVPRNNFRRK